MLGYSSAARAFMLFLAVATLLPVGKASAAGDPLPGTRTIPTEFGFAALVQRLEEAVTANGMFVVTRASASTGAAARGIEIPGNMVLGVFRNDYAVRMLEASVPAGIEAPIRFYVTENPNGTASLSYRKPSAVFAGYGSAALDGIAAELDAVWATIAAEAAGR